MADRPTNQQTDQQTDIRVHREGSHKMYRAHEPILTSKVVAQPDSNTFFWHCAGLRRLVLLFLCSFVVLILEEMIESSFTTDSKEW